MKRNNALLLLLATFLVISELGNHKCVALPLQCRPSKLHQLPTRVTRICMALLTINDLGTSMEQYIMENAPLVDTEDLESLPIRDASKRQDVDHVFLRFGKRR